jgi:dipeptidyl aminopeptidase/acylaminoacyl peptidase
MPRAIVILPLLLAAVYPSAVEAQRASSDATRALSIEDYYRIQSVNNPRISPDGRWVVFEVSTRMEEDNRTHTESYVVPSDGSSRPRRAVHYGKDIENPRWTEGGRVAYWQERRQWTMDPASGATAPAGADSLITDGVVSPDRRWIAITEDKPRTSSETTALTEFERRHEERFKGVTFDWKDFQRDGAPLPAPDPTARPAERIVVRAIDESASRVLVNLDLRPSNLAWHPGGPLLAFTADSDWRDELKYGRADLWTVTIDGEVTRLTDDGYVYDDVAFSPDGRYLSYERSYGTDMIIEQRLDHGGPRDLFIRPVEGGDPINLTASWDLEPRGTRWSPDGRFVYFTAGIGGEVHLFRVSVPHGVVEQITRGPRRLGDVTFDSRMAKMAYTVGVHDAPPEVYVANVDGSGEKKLTDVHAPVLAEIAFSRTERLEWPSYDGTRIEGWLTFPYRYDPTGRPYPLIVTSHGGPHSATGYGFNFKKQFFAANGYFVLDANFRGSTGYGEAFKWATWGAWGDKDGEDVTSGVDYVLERYPIDPNRVGHTGHSYGGFLTNWVITQYPDRFAAAVSGAGISNWISDYGTADIYRTKETEFFGPPWEPEARERLIRQSPLTYAGRVRTPTLFVHGEVDQRVPYEEAEQMYFALKRRGVPAKMIQYADQAHGIRGNWNNVHRMLNELRWWDTYLTKSRAATSGGTR